jgi:hypothetical protein
MTDFCKVPLSDIYLLFTTVIYRKLSKYRNENYFGRGYDAVVFQSTELSAKIFIILERAIYITIFVLYQDIFYMG